MKSQNNGLRRTPSACSKYCRHTKSIQPKWKSGSVFWRHTHFPISKMLRLSFTKKVFFNYSTKNATITSRFFFFTKNDDSITSK